MNLLKPSTGCTKGSIDVGGRCYCEDHCSWERCKLTEKPNDSCVPTAQSKWDWDTENDFWVLKFES